MALILGVSDSDVLSIPLPETWVLMGGLTWVSQFALLHGGAFCLELKIPAHVWLMWGILWELVCVCVCVCVCMCVCP